MLIRGVALDNFTPNILNRLNRLILPYPDRIQLPQKFDAKKMAAEYDAMGLHDYVYYSSIMLNIPKPGTRPGPHDPPTDYPYLRHVIDSFRAHTKVTLARLLRLEPGAVVRRHTDPMLGLEIPDSVIRLTIPISGQEGVQFFLNDTLMPMQAGECWYMRLSDPHEIHHSGPEERVNFTIDVTPNAWVMQQLNLEPVH